MKHIFRSGMPLDAFRALAAAAVVSQAETPAQMEYERQQREYWRQQEQQRQEQQRQQQLMQENARRQQEESSRINSGKSQGDGSQGGAAASGGAPGRAGGQSGADALSAARTTWEKRPPLPPERNPLLGRWTRPASAASKSSDPFAGLQALVKGGMCEVLFGGGVFEFRPDRLVGMDANTRGGEQELDRVEYRGDDTHVVVIPKTTLKLMQFDFEGPDRINWTSQKCVLVRVKGGATSASTGPAAGAAAAAASTAASKSTTPAASGERGGALNLSVGAPSAANKVAGRKLWVLKEDAQVALIKGGIRSTPDRSVLQNWMQACSAHTADCQKGALALKPYSVGLATTDETGHAQTPSLPPGRYWVLSDAKVANKHVMWNQPVDVKGGDRSLTLDERNAMPVD